jgi:D-glycero-D-manno-heptose 1,7-bisphosphate phosphatase
MARPAVFIDRDGTLIEDVDYLTSVDQIRFLPSAIPAMKKLHDAGYAIVVVTNQSAVARGLLTEEELDAIHEALVQQVEMLGGTIDAIYYCPHLPSAEAPKKGRVAQRYIKECSCRKPKPGLLLKARDELGLDLDRSFSVGDSWRDVEAALAVGVPSVKVPRPSSRQERLRTDLFVMGQADSLGQAAEMILEADVEQVHDRVRRAMTPPPPPAPPQKAAEPPKPSPVEKAPEKPVAKQPEKVAPPPAAKPADKPAVKTPEKPTVQTAEKTPEKRPDTATKSSAAPKPTQEMKLDFGPLTEAKRPPAKIEPEPEEEELPEEEVEKRDAADAEAMVEDQEEEIVEKAEEEAETAEEVVTTGSEVEPIEPEYDASLAPSPLLERLSSQSEPAGVMQPEEEVPEEFEEETEGQESPEEEEETEEPPARPDSTKTTREAVGEMISQKTSHADRETADTLVKEREATPTTKAMDAPATTLPPAAPKTEKPPTCGRCGVDVLPLDVTTGKAGRVHGALLCPQCFPEVSRMSERASARAAEVHAVVPAPTSTAGVPKATLDDVLAELRLQRQSAPPTDGLSWARMVGLVAQVLAVAVVLLPPLVRPGWSEHLNEYLIWVLLGIFLQLVTLTMFLIARKKES